jgi:hypothetical protein
MATVVMAATGTIGNTGTMVAVMGTTVTTMATIEIDTIGMAVGSTLARSVLESP